MAQQGSLGAENGLLGRGGAGMPRYVFVYGYIWDCVTVTLFDCVNSGRSGSRSRSKSENASSNSSSPSQLPSDGNALDSLFISFIQLPSAYMHTPTTFSLSSPRTTC